MSLQCHWDQAWTQQRLPKNIQKKDRAHQNCCDATLKHPVPITPWLLCQWSKCAIKGQSPILGLDLLNQFAHALCFHFCHTNFFFACQHLHPINLQRAKWRSANFCSTWRCCPSGLTNDICGTQCSTLCPTLTNSHEEPCSQQNNRPSAVQWQRSSSLRRLHFPVARQHHPSWLACHCCVVLRKMLGAPICSDLGVCGRVSLCHIDFFAHSSCTVLHLNAGSLESEDCICCDLLEEHKKEAAAKCDIRLCRCLVMWTGLSLGLLWRTCLRSKRQTSSSCIARKFNQLH